MMATKTIGIKYERSPLDETLFFFVYHGYDPDQVISIIVTVRLLADTLASDARIGAVHVQAETSSLEGKSAVDFVVPFSGTIEQVEPIFQKVTSNQQLFYQLQNPQKKGKLKLFSFRLCEHQPRQHVKDGNGLMPKHDVCAFCEETLWVYDQKEETQVKIDQLLAAYSTEITLFKREDPKCLSRIQWQLVVNEHFTPNTTVATLEDLEIKVNHIGRVTYMLSFSDWHEQQTSKCVAMKFKKTICKHQKIKDNLCQFCLQAVKEQQFQQCRTYMFQLENGKDCPAVVRGNALIHQEAEYINRMLSAGKAILILDLDNTILHSISLSELQEESARNLSEYYLIPSCNPNLKKQRDYMVVKMRSFFKEFLYEISHLFQVYIYTKGTRQYAERICYAVRSQYAGEVYPENLKSWVDDEANYFLKGSQCFKPYRIISRNEDPNLAKKSLEHILPTKKNYHLILDDRRDIWDNSTSWFYTREYFYFNKNNSKENRSGGYTVANNASQFNVSKQLNLTKEIATQTQIVVQYSKIDSKIQDIGTSLVESVVELSQAESKQTESVPNLTEALTHLAQPVVNVSQPIQFSSNSNPQTEFYIPSPTTQPIFSQQKPNQSEIEIDIQQPLPPQQPFREPENQQQRLKRAHTLYNDIYQGEKPVRANPIQINPNSDHFLLYASNSLRQIHRQFFQTLKNQPNNTQVSISDVHMRLRKGLLAQYKIKFIMPKYEGTQSYKRAIKMGATIIKDSSELPHIVIRSSAVFTRNTILQRTVHCKFIPQTFPVEMIKDLKFFSLTFSIPIVLSTWIHDCYEYTHHFKHEMFMVEPTDFFVHNRTLLAMRQEIAEDAMQIRQRISERMQEG